MPTVDIVNKNDEVIGITSDHIVSTSIITRSVAIFLFNSKGELLLQKRSSKMFRYPLHWECSANGAVDSGEDYLTAAKRELKEELGVDNVSLELLFKKIVVTDKKEFAQLYKVVYDGEIKTNKFELEGAKFFSVNEIKQMIANKEKITHYFMNLFNELFP